MNNHNFEFLFLQKIIIILMNYILLSLFLLSSLVSYIKHQRCLIMDKCYVHNIFTTYPS